MDPLERGRQRFLSRFSTAAYFVSCGIPPLERAGQNTVTAANLHSPSRGAGNVRTSKSPRFSPACHTKLHSKQQAQSNPLSNVLSKPPSCWQPSPGGWGRMWAPGPQGARATRDPSRDTYSLGWVSNFPSLRGNSLKQKHRSPHLATHYCSARHTH